MIPGILRLQLLVAERGRTIAAVVVVFGLLLLVGSGWVYAHPPTEELTEQTNEQVIRTSVDTSAVVIGNTSLWDSGAQLQNAEFYPAAAPRLHVRATTTLQGNGSGVVQQGLSIRYQVVKDGDVLWAVEEPLRVAEQNVTDGEVVVAETIDIRDVRDRKAQIDEEMTGIGTTEVHLSVNTTYETDRYSGAFSETAPVVVAERGYWLDGSLDGDRTHTESTQRTITHPSNLVATGRLVGLGVTALIVGVVVVVVSRRLPTPASLRDELERQRYGEWISEVVFEGDIPERRVQMRTLGGLVNLGIDSKKRTFYDPSRGLYGVIDDTVFYYYIETGRCSIEPSVRDHWEWPFDQPTVEPDRPERESVILRN